MVAGCYFELVSLGNVGIDYKRCLASFDDARAVLFVCLECMRNVEYSGRNVEKKWPVKTPVIRHRFIFFRSRVRRQ
jgi:hypothetical protein